MTPWLNNCWSVGDRIPPAGEPDECGCPLGGWSLLWSVGSVAVWGQFFGMMNGIPCSADVPAFLRDAINRR